MTGQLLAQIYECLREDPENGENYGTAHDYMVEIVSRLHGRNQEDLLHLPGTPFDCSSQTPPQRYHEGRSAG